MCALIRGQVAAGMVQWLGGQAKDARIVTHLKAGQELAVLDFHRTVALRQHRSVALNSFPAGRG